MVWFLDQQKRRAVEQGHYSTVDLRPAPTPATPPVASILPAPDPAVAAGLAPGTQSPYPPLVTPPPAPAPSLQPAPAAPTTPAPLPAQGAASGSPSAPQAPSDGFVPPALGGNITGGVAKDFLLSQPLNRHSRLPGPEMGNRRNAIGRMLSKKR